MNLGNIFQFILWVLILGTAGCGTSNSPPQPESRTRSSVDLNSADSVDQEDEGDDRSRNQDDEGDQDNDEEEEDEELVDGEETSSKDDEEEADDDKGETGDLVITANETQNDDAKIAVRSEGGTWEEFAWPKSGTPITVKGVCSKKPLEVRATNEEGEAVTLPHADFGVLTQAKSTASLGYEPTHCTGTKCWDDNTITMECTKGDLKLKGI